MVQFLATIDESSSIMSSLPVGYVVEEAVNEEVEFPNSMSSLPAGYVAEVDSVNAASWNGLLLSFSDAIFYQMWSYGAVKRGEEKLSHLLLRKDGVAVAAAQLTIVSIPLLGPQMAHVRFGPLWRNTGFAANTEHYEAMLTALREEYVDRRRLLLRLKPWEHADEQQALTSVRAKAGFLRQENLLPYETFVLDVSIGIDDIHRGLSRDWRRNLKLARKQNFVTRCSRSSEDLQKFLLVYRDMHVRSSFADFTDIHLLEKTISDSPEAMRPFVMLAEDSGEVVSGLIFSVAGDRALALYSASTDDGRKRGASYVVNWAVLNWLKEDGRCRWYDLVGGLANPGIRRFKAGLAKGCGVEVHMGDYDAGGSSFTRWIVRVGEQLRPLVASVWARFRRQ